jgi:hypothetical protein
MNIKTAGEFTTIHRDDGKVVISSTMVYDHIGKHGELGAGSIFSGGITPEMINDFLIGADIPKTGGGIPANFPGGGYLLVAPFESAMKLQDAVVKEGAKEDFDPKQKKMVPVPIAEVHTSQPMEDFATDETTVLVFPYDPNRSSPAQNDFIQSDPELSVALDGGTLYALATAFPGGFKVDGQEVPKATSWGGIENPTWAVIIPDSPLANPVTERWNRLAGL